MKALKIIAGLISFFVVMPIWYYLLHYLLIKSGADDLQMFLFWVYLPFAIFAGLIFKIIESIDRGGKP